MIMPFITAANAKDLSAIGVETRRLKKQTKLVRLMQYGPELDRYAARRLMRVRHQLVLVSETFEAEIVKKMDLDRSLAIDRLASAIARLSEIERQLANRPLPGSFKPQSASSKARRVHESVLLDMPVEPKQAEAMPAPAEAIQSAPLPQPGIK